MNITKIKFLINDAEKDGITFKKKWTVFYSKNGLNSQGKSTIIRSILYGMGFIKKNNFVDGTNIKDLVVILEFGDNLIIKRSSRELIFKTKDTPGRVFLVNNNNYIDEITQHYKLIFKQDWNFIPTFLFANYVDQQYGSHVVNRGMTGLFPKSLKFSIEQLTKEIDNDYHQQKILEDKQKQYNDLMKALSFIKSNTSISKDQSELLDKNKEEILLIQRRDKLKLRKDLYEKMIRESTNKANLINFFESEFHTLNLIYKDDKKQFHRLTKNNFKDSIDLEKIVIKTKIDDLNIQLEKVEKELKAYDDEIGSFNFKKMSNIINYKRMVLDSQLVIHEKQLNSFSDKAAKLEDEIEKIKSKMANKEKSKISQYIYENLSEFSKVNNDIKIWLEKHGNDIHKLLLNSNAKFKSYIGAIRFIIATSVKIALSRFMWEKGIKLPIIIDNIKQEELDYKTQMVYISLIEKLPQNIIVASLTKDFISEYEIKSDKVFSKGMDKTLFDDEQMSIFSTLE